jgi:hypothetical protein
MCLGMRMEDIVLNYNGVDTDGGRCLIVEMKSPDLGSLGE